MAFDLVEKSMMRDSIKSKSVPFLLSSLQDRSSTVLSSCVSRSLVISSESMMEFNKNVVSTKLVHYLAVNYLFHRFTDYACQGGWMVYN